MINNQTEKPKPPSLIISRCCGGEVKVEFRKGKKDLAVREGGVLAYYVCQTCKKECDVKNRPSQ